MLRTAQYTKIFVSSEIKDVIHFGSSLQPWDYSLKELSAISQTAFHTYIPPYKSLLLHIGILPTEIALSPGIAKSLWLLPQFVIFLSTWHLGSKMPAKLVHSYKHYRFLMIPNPPRSWIIGYSICFLYFCMWNVLFYLKQLHPLPLMLIDYSLAGESSVSKSKTVDIAVACYRITSSTLCTASWQTASIYSFFRMSLSNLCY